MIDFAVKVGNWDSDHITKEFHSHLKLLEKMMVTVFWSCLQAVKEEDWVLTHEFLSTGVFIVNKENSGPWGEAENESSICALFMPVPGDRL